MFPSAHTPAVAATDCLVQFLLDPAAALGRHPPWRVIMKLQCPALVADFLLGVSSAVCTRLPPSVLAGLRLPAWSSVRSWLLCLRSGPLSAVWSFVCAGAASCAYSCSAHVRPCAQGRCGRCPPGSGVMWVQFFWFVFPLCGFSLSLFCNYYSFGFFWKVNRAPGDNSGLGGLSHSWACTQFTFTQPCMHGGKGQQRRRPSCASLSHALSNA